MTTAARLAAPILSQQGHLFPWVPVCLAVGIALYFAQGVEPAVPRVGLIAVSGLGLTCVAVLPVTPAILRILLWALALVALGFSLGSARAHMVAGPVIESPTYGPVTGRIVGIDRSASGAPRLTLDQVSMPRLPPHRTPHRVRISVTGQGPHTAFFPGRMIATTAYVSPPRGAAEPGGFDFRRHAWFQRLGAVGYTQQPVVAVAPPAGKELSLWLTSARMALSARVQQALPGPAGGVTAAILTGDRSALDPDAVDNLRATNLAHLLAISGLHMGLAAGVVFGFVRGGLALIPWVALYWPIKRIAAVAGLIAAGGYLALSGGNVATERAFVMVSVALVAVLLDRRALSLRGVAIAATIVLTLRPEALLSPGFQMSFAATLALVATFAAIRDHAPSRAPGWARPFVALVVSSGVAGLATAPVAAAHFNIFAHYGLIANLASVPLMGAIIMPACIMGLALMPLGLEHLPFQVAGLGISWILGVADFVAGWDGAVSGIPVPPAWILPTLALAGLWLALIHGVGRLAAVPVLVGTLFFWTGAQRPDVLIDAEGDLVGIRDAATRSLSRAKGAGFVASIWLENDGKRVPQSLAANDWPTTSKGWDIVHLAGKRAARAPPDCTQGRIVVTNVELELTGPCLVLDPDKLRATGSVALWRDDTGGWRVLTDSQVSGTRLWSPAQRQPDPFRGWTQIAKVDQ